MACILKTLHQREDFTDTQIVHIGLRLDEGAADWILIVGKEGMMNKTHDMTSGHMVYYLSIGKISIIIATKGGNISIHNKGIYIATLDRRLAPLAHMANLVRI
jgi:hypothetical protein